MLIQILTLLNLALANAQTPTIIGVFNDRAAGVTEPALARINDLPCGKNGRDPFLICIQRTQAIHLSRQSDVFHIVRNFSQEIARANASSVGLRWTHLLFTNLSAVVLDPDARKPELRLQAGTDDPIDSSKPSLYIRLPSLISVKGLRKWLNRNVELLNPRIIAAFMLRDFQDVLRSHKSSKDEKLLFEQLYDPRAIRIKKLLPDDRYYAKAQAEAQELEPILDPETEKRMVQILEQCMALDQPWDGFERCLLLSRYTGNYSYVDRNGTFIEGRFVKGKHTGSNIWEDRQESQVNRCETEYDENGLTKFESFSHTDANGRQIPADEIYYENGRKVRVIHLRKDGTPAQINDFNPESKKLIKDTVYCPDGINVRWISTYFDDGEPSMHEEFDCPN